MTRLGINKSDIVVSAPARQKGKETTDSDQTRQVRKLMNNTFISNCVLVSNATYLETIYKRDASKKILLDKNGEKAIEGYKTKHLTGHYIVEDNGDGTSTATKFNVYKDTFIIDNESLSLTQVTNGNGTK